MKTITIEHNGAKLEITQQAVMQNFLHSLGSSLSAPTQSQTNPPPIGEYWHGQGGIYAGVMRDPASNQQWHLIAHPGEKLAKEKWGGYEKESEATSKSDGQLNTAKLLNSRTDHPAAEIAAKAEHEGHSDYYLPAQTELQLLHANLHDKLGDEICWSSTQYSADGAWGQGFELGNHGIDYEDRKLAVRAVRRILAI